jgi:hypothetical protein
MIYSNLLADDTVNLVPTNYTNLAALRPSSYAATAINILIGGAGVLSFIFLLYGGVTWIMAGSDKDAVDKSRKRVTQALIGLAVVFSAYALIFIIRVLFQVDLLQFTITNLGA